MLFGIFEEILEDFINNVIEDDEFTGELEE